MINSIKLANFRSHKLTELNFKAHTTAIIGLNASGKTSILEALYYGFITKSFKSGQAQLINRDKDYSKINIGYTTDKPYNLEYRIKNNNNYISRTISLNGATKKPSEIVGIQPIVLFMPDDVKIITDGPQYRRRLLNNIIIQVSKDYLRALNVFHKLLTQRNKLLYSLKHNYSNNKDQLFIYNLQLSEPIETIYRHRDELVEFINTQMSNKYSAISANKDTVHIDHLNSLPKSKEDILRSLELHTDEDINIGYTAKGPHKDELGISLNGYPTRETLSRGENRTLSLAIKLAEIEYINTKTNTPPLLLLDDVLSELDARRQSHLLELSKSQQTILTATSVAKNINAYEIIKI